MDRGPVDLGLWAPSPCHPHKEAEVTHCHSGSSADALQFLKSEKRFSFQSKPDPSSPGCPPGSGCGQHGGAARSSLLLREPGLKSPTAAAFLLGQLPKCPSFLPSHTGAEHPKLNHQK